MQVQRVWAPQKTSTQVWDAARGHAKPRKAKRNQSYYKLYKHLSSKTALFKQRRPYPANDPPERRCQVEAPLPAPGTPESDVERPGANDVRF